MPLVMEAVERGLVPDRLIRAGIRRLLARKLQHERRGGPDAQRERRARLLTAMQDSAIALHTGDANRQHYELPPAFFEAVLGGRLKYSSGYWPEGVRALDDSGQEGYQLSAHLRREAARVGRAEGEDRRPRRSPDRHAHHGDAFHRLGLLRE